MARGEGIVWCSVLPLVGDGWINGMSRTRAYGLLEDCMCNNIMFVHVCLCVCVCVCVFVFVCVHVGRVHVGQCEHKQLASVVYISVQYER